MAKSTKFVLAKDKCWGGVIPLLAVLMVPATSLAATINGVLEIKWGDPFFGGTGSQLSLSLETSDNISYPLNVPDDVLRNSGGAQSLFNRRVTVTTEDDLPLRQPGSTVPPPRLDVLSIELGSVINAQPLAVQSISQTQRFVSILCGYAGNSSQPEPLSFFENMYGDLAGELNHYWKEVSSDNINIDGSSAHGWYTLPQNRDYYLNQANTLTALFNDCVGVADNDIDFTTVDGINLMFNDQIDGFAWGGSRYTTLDGVTKSWPTTWEPPWGWGNVTVMAHEMGHAFGLPHSNNSDMDGYPYDNPWTVMSDAWSFGVSDSVYGTRGKHLNTYEKETLGWFSSTEVYVHDNSSQQTVIIDPINFSVAGPGAFRAAKIPVNASDLDYYTVEVRVDGTAGGEYDANLPGTAVIIHTVDLSRNEPSWVIDADTPPAGNAYTEGVMWRVGEVFEDQANGVRVSVDSLSANGFEVTIGYPGNQDIPLTIGTRDENHYGHNHGTNQHRDRVSFSFDGDSDDLTLNVTGYDIDFNSEVKVLINNTEIGYLASGANNEHTAEQILAVDNSLLQSTGNILTFEQQTSGYKWGVSDVLLSIDSSTAPIPLAIGTRDENHYGHNHGTNQHKDSVSFSFDGNTTDLTLDVVGFDIDFNSEVKVLINNTEIGYLASGPNNGHTTEQSLEVDKSLLQVSNNTLTFEQRTSGFKWGVSDVLLSINSSNPIPLTIGIRDTTHYGHKHGTDQHQDGVSFSFDGNADDLTLSVVGFDIDYNTEVKVLVNSTEIGYLTSGANNAHTSEQSLMVDKSLLQGTGNTLTFEQRTSGFKWGVSDVLLDVAQ